MLFFVHFFFSKTNKCRLEKCTNDVSFLIRSKGVAKQRNDKATAAKGRAVVSQRGIFVCARPTSKTKRRI